MRCLQLGVLTAGVLCVCNGRWVSGAVFAASAAAALSLSSLTPVVHALEDGLSAYNSPANIGIAIAIPIPDPDQWVFSEYGFIAPLPGRGREDVRSMTFEAYGGCPAWQVMEFERVVPDHGHKKPFPRRGGQWPASLSADEAAPIVVIADGGEDGNQDFSFYPHLEDVLEEMSGLGALACFTL